jgi:S1-C subfamily serine protease
MKRKFQILAVAAILLFALLSCQTLTGVPSKSPEVSFPPAVTAIVKPNVAVNVPPPLDLVSSQDTLVNLYKQVNPGIVAIRVLTSDGGGLGSGFVIDMDGHVVTNYHVVENETDLEVAFPSGYKVRGEVIGTDLDSDLAVIKIDAPKSELHPLVFGDSDLVQVGQTVVAIGNPFGYEGTMTVGIVSGLGRTLRSLHTTADGGSFSASDIIQTDAAINPGNSGGPLFNLNGEVVGINQAIQTNNFTLSGEPTNSGIGFAISSNIVKRVTPFLISAGKYDYPYLGITSKGSDLTLMEQEALGLSRSTGVYVTGVTAGGPAEKAGLHGGSQDTSIPGLQAGGDLIIAVDGQPVLTYNDLIGYLVKSKSPGDKVNLTIIRDGKEMNLELTLDKRPAE